MRLLQAARASQGLAFLLLPVRLVVQEALFIIDPDCAVLGASDQQLYGILIVGFVLLFLGELEEFDVVD